jgi:hypothetical protein
VQIAHITLKIAAQIELRDRVPRDYQKEVPAIVGTNLTYDGCRASSVLRIGTSRLLARRHPRRKRRKRHCRRRRGRNFGQSDISAYTFGLMGFKTPNIDRIAKEGMMLPTTMRSRAAPPAGHHHRRGDFAHVPGATVDLQKENINLAEALKPLG